MYRIIFFIGISVVFSGTIFGKSSEIIPELSLDTLNNQIELNYSNDEMPISYSCDVFTPVCLVGECLPIRITLYWDLAGNYQKFELKHGEILTKTEHAPFTSQDYQLLHAILKNPTSELKRYTMKEVTGQTDNSKSVDGVSGATITGLRGHYVPEALFSSHRLWHLANGEIKKKLLNYTMENLFVKFPITYFLNSSISNCQQEAINYFCQVENISFTTFFETLLDTSDSDLIKVALQGASFETLMDSKIKSSLSNYYLHTNNEQNRLALLNKWKEIPLDSIEITAISSIIGRYQSQFNQEISILEIQTRWPEITYFDLIRNIEKEGNLLKKEVVLKLLISREQAFSKEVQKTVKRMIKQEDLQELISN